ncbi:hypothetical protein ILUMI_00162 [Ignelater luminosus]|uniref:Uncharacterized protein n=1 Tax=Ignelater luminosus TaxID=2038154 RepID=A0A8K0GMW5_IGNLU|nr:hypothetical protein ILUMI_00162 [Ignelater luminosus]
MNSNLLPNNRLFRQAMGSLSYIAVNTRADIAVRASRAHDWTHCPTDSMVANALTKLLAGTKFGRHVASTGLCDVIIEKRIVAGWQ